MNAHLIALDPNFVKLDEVLKRFNIFNATGMKKQEIKHTRFLGYLLDPNESHGLGSKFLLEFLRNTNQSNKNSGKEIVNVLDLNLALAKVSTEYSLGTIDGRERRIDILIEVSNSKGEKEIVIGIENKLDSGQGNDQLISYKKGINKNYNSNCRIFLYYLTLQGERPDDADWIGVTYEDTVVLIIKKILGNEHEIVSDYFLSILKDYLELIRDSENDSSEADDLVEEIKKEYRDYIKSPKNATDINLQKLKILYPRACELLEKFDGDPRLDIRKYFENKFKSSELKDQQNLLESSDRSCLRFSCLTENNQHFFSNQISSTPAKRWLKSKRNLAFELRLTLNSKNCIDGQVKLILGTTNPGYERRQELIEKLTNLLNPVERSFKTSESSDYSTIKIVGGFPSFVNKDKDSVKKWINEEFLPLGQKYGKQINEAICYFQSCA